MIDPIPGHSTVAVLGLGSSGLGAVRLLHALGKSVIAVDANPNASASQIASLADVRLGSHEFAPASAVVLSPSLNPEWPGNRDNPALVSLWSQWRSGSVDLWTETELAAAAWDGPLIAVGGTDGKSTTAALTAHLARELAGTGTLAGNSWKPLSSVLLDSPPGPGPVVLEVSAFQLHEPHRFRPDVSVMMNIAADHLDHYASMAEYVAAKRQILRNQRPGSAAVLYAADPTLREWLLPLHERGLFAVGFDNARVGPEWSGAACEGNGSGADRTLSWSWGDRTDTVSASALAIPGAHNRRNALAAWSALRLLCERRGFVADPDALAAALGSFRGLPHRIEFVRERRGVRYFDDSKATNVHAALTGLRSFDSPLVAIVGGVDKNLDLSALIDELSRRARHVVVIGQLRERLRNEAGARLPSLAEAATMEEAVAQAAGAASDGDVVLLAPASSSFDMFRSFEHRGDCFAAAVRALPD